MFAPGDFRRRVPYFQEGLARRHPDSWRHELVWRCIETSCQAVRVCWPSRVEAAVLGVLGSFARTRPVTSSQALSGSMALWRQGAANGYFPAAPNRGGRSSTFDISTVRVLKEVSCEKISRRGPAGYRLRTSLWCRAHFRLGGHFSFRCSEWDFYLSWFS